MERGFFYTIRPMWRLSPGHFTRAPAHGGETPLTLAEIQYLFGCLPTGCPFQNPHPYNDGGIVTMGSSMPNEVYVVIGSSGEYSDRSERVIGYVLTEDEAQRAVLQAEAEISFPRPPQEDTHAWFLPDGEIWEKPQGWVCAAPDGSQRRERPDAAEIALRNEAALSEWRSGRIDPEGPMESYYYEVAPAINPSLTHTPPKNT